MRLEAVGWVLASSAVAASPARGVEADRHAQVDAIFAEYRRTDSPGCALGVFHQGGIEYSRGYGMANLELGAAITPSTVFDIGSTSKQFTAFSILLLEGDGKLSTDDDVRKYVPELPYYGPTITIRHLMQHTSGLRDYLGLFRLAGVDSRDVTTGQDALDAIVRQKALNFEPGDEYLYSNSGFFLLSEIVKRASGKTLAEFSRERIFEPLGMRHTRYLDDPQDVVPNRSTGYDRTDEGDLEIDMSDFEQVGDGAVYTTIEDLFLWDQNFYHSRVGTREMLERMQTPGRLSTGKPIAYGLGLEIRDYRGLASVSHGGSWAGYGAELLRFPVQRLSVACLCNFGSVDPSEMALEVAEVYLSSLMTPEEAPPTPVGVALADAELRSRAGSYWDRVSGDYAFLSPKEGKLLLEIGGSAAMFRPLSASLFVAESAPGVEISLESGTLALNRRGEVQSFQRIEPFRPGLEEFKGRYRSEEVAGSIDVDVEEGALVLRHRRISREPLRPTRKDSFYVDGLSLTFTRDTEGEVSGFTLDMGRVKGVVYSKER